MTCKVIHLNYCSVFSLKKKKNLSLCSNISVYLWTKPILGKCIYECTILFWVRSRRLKSQVYLATLKSKRLRTICKRRTLEMEQKEFHSKSYGELKGLVSDINALFVHVNWHKYDTKTRNSNQISTFHQKPILLTTLNHH